MDETKADTMDETKADTMDETKDETKAETKDETKDETKAGATQSLTSFETCRCTGKPHVEMDFNYLLVCHDCGEFADDVQDSKTMSVTCAMCDKVALSDNYEDMGWDYNPFNGMILCTRCSANETSHVFSILHMMKELCYLLIFVGFVFSMIRWMTFSHHDVC